MFVDDFRRRRPMARNAELFDRFGNLIADETNISCCPKISRWCVKDVEGIIFCIVTWLLLFYGYAVLMFVILIPQNYSWTYILINWMILHLLEFLAFTSHCRAIFVNPVGVVLRFVFSLIMNSFSHHSNQLDQGTIPLNETPIENLLEQNNDPAVRLCHTCRSVKPFRTRHCRVCNRCVRRMDHHCIFINNCVGENNQKYFILFTFYTCLLTIYGMCVVLRHIFGCVQSNWKACPFWPSPVTLIFSILTTLEGFGFFVFTLTMTVMQYFSLWKDATTVEIFRNNLRPREERRPFYSSLESVFGSPISWRWLNPFSHPSHLIVQHHQF